MNRANQVSKFCFENNFLCSAESGAKNETRRMQQNGECVRHCQPTNWFSFHTLGGWKKLLWISVCPQIRCQVDYWQVYLLQVLIDRMETQDTSTLFFSSLMLSTRISKDRIVPHSTHLSEQKAMATRRMDCERRTRWCVCVALYLIHTNRRHFSRKFKHSNLLSFSLSVNISAR